MALTQRTLSTVTASNILDALKSILGSGWTLDTENSVLWKSTPSAFPIGFFVDEKSSAAGVAVKSNGVIVFSNTRSSFSSDSTCISVYSAPNGSVGVSISAPSTGIILPTMLILRNSNVNDAMARDMGFIATHSAQKDILSPMSAKAYSISNGWNVNVLLYANSSTLTQLSDPYTGTALKDLFLSLSTTGSSSPSVVANGNNRYVKCSNTDIYLRYI